MNLRNAKVGDRIKVVDTYEGEVTHTYAGVVTIGNRYSLSDGIGDEDAPEGLVRTRETTMVKAAIPDVLPVGSVVLYKKNLVPWKWYVQTETGWQDLAVDAISNNDPKALATDIRNGRAELRYMP